MKTIIVILLIVFSPIIIQAQELPCKAKFKNGRCKERYKEDSQGNIHGTYIEYDENGNRLALGNYSHGKKQGQWKYPATNLFGQIIGEETMNFIDGELEGEYTLINNSSGAKESGKFTKGKKAGFWKERSETLDGEVVYQSGTYVDGLREGKWLNVRKTSDYALSLQGYMAGDQMLNIGSTKKGYYAIYSKGEVVSYFDNKGVNLSEAEKAEKNLSDKLETERQAGWAKIAEAYKKVSSPSGTVVDIEQYAELQSKYDPNSSTKFKKTDLNWLKQLNGFLDPSSNLNKLEITFQEFERYVILNYLKDKTKFDLTSLYKENDLFTKISLYKTDGAGKTLDRIVLGDYWLTTFLLEGEKENIVLITHYASFGSPVRYVVHGGSKSEINLQTKYYNGSFNTLTEPDKFYTLLALSYKLYETRNECIDAEFFNQFIGSLMQLTPEHKATTAQMFSTGILGADKSGRACTNKASQDKKSVSITYGAYALWEAGYKDHAIQYFKYVNDNKPSFNRYKPFEDKWEPCSYSDYLTKYFHKWYINNKSGVEDLKSKLNSIQLTDEKELLDALKSI